MMRLRRRQGFVLLTALWLLVAISAVMLAASLESRSRRNVVANALDRTRARAAALAGSEYARSQLSAALVGRADEYRSMAGRRGNTSFRRIALLSEPWWAPQQLVEPVRQVDGLAFDVRLQDVGSMLDINMAQPDDLRRFFANGLGIDYARADKLAQAIADWRDADDIPRVGGAERDDYIRAGAMRLPTNRPFASIEELRYVLGMTPELFEAARPYLSALGMLGRINVNSAPEPVLLSLPGFTPAAAEAVIRARESGQPPANFNELLMLLPANVRETPNLTQELQQRVVFLSIMVLIEAEGGVEGSAVRTGQRTIVGNGFFFGQRPGEAVEISRVGGG